MPVGKTYWVEENMLGTTLENLDRDGDGKADHVRFGVKSSFIHADHPLGWIRDIRVEIDRQPVAPEDIFFVLRRNWIPLSCLPTISDIWWHMAENAYVTVRRLGGITPGTHRVSVTMEFSSLFNTRTVDYDDLSRRMPMTLSGTMTTDEQIYQEGKV